MYAQAGGNPRHEQISRDDEKILESTSEVRDQGKLTTRQVTQYRNTWHCADTWMH
jgi:hypothetical protein